MVNAFAHGQLVGIRSVGRPLRPTRQRRERVPASHNPYSQSGGRCISYRELELLDIAWSDNPGRKTCLVACPIRPLTLGPVH